MKQVMSRAQEQQKSAIGAPPVAEPVDLAHLRRFTLGEKQLETEILGLFMAQVPITIAALKHAESDGAWYAAAHSLKGSASAVGARRLALLAAQAERLGGISEQGSCGMMVSMLEEAADEAQAFIGSLGCQAQHTS